LFWIEAEASLAVPLALLAVLIILLAAAVASPPSQSSLHGGNIAISDGRRTDEHARFAAAPRHCSHFRASAQQHTPTSRIRQNLLCFNLSVTFSKQTRVSLYLPFV